MSDDFDILEYLKKNPVRWKPKQYEPPLALNWWKQDQDSKDDSIQELSNRIFHRHHPVIDILPPITIRQVRHIEAPNNWPPFGMVNHRQNVVSEVVVKAVRPYAHKSRTSSYWQDTGWKRGKEGNLSGQYRAGDRLFTGEIILTDSIVQPTGYYIYDPPLAILNGPHDACFHARGKSNGRKKYWIHFSEEPADIDSGIIQIERVLSEALGMY